MKSPLNLNAIFPIALYPKYKFEIVKLPTPSLTQRSTDGVPNLTDRKCIKCYLSLSLLLVPSPVSVPQSPKWAGVQSL